MFSPAAIENLYRIGKQEIVVVQEDQSVAARKLEQAVDVAGLTEPIRIAEVAYTLLAQERFDGGRDLVAPRIVRDDEFYVGVCLRENRFEGFHEQIGSFPRGYADRDEGRQSSSSATGCDVASVL